MTADRVLIEQAADRLFGAYTGTPVAPVRTELPEGDLDAAYAVQRVNTARWLAAGRRLVGRKIGATSLAIQKQLGVSQCDYGVLLDDMAFGDRSSIRIAGRLLQPRIEVEVAFVLKKSIEGRHCTTADVISAVEYLLPAIEIVDSRIRNWDIGIVDTIADNASSGAFVLGSSPVSPLARDLRNVAMALSRNGVDAAFGCGAACLGNPWNALQWLAQKMVDVGEPLQAGEVVLSGALGPLTAIEQGDHFRADLGPLGSVEVSFK